MITARSGRRVGLLAAAVIAAMLAGCVDQRRGGGWRFDTTTAGADTGGVDRRRIDSGGDRDTGRRGDADAGGGDVTTDVAVDTAVADVGDSRVEAVGWYRQSFETSSFMPEGEYVGAPNGSRCSLEIALGPSGEEWWASGLATDVGLRVTGRRDTHVGLFEMSGTISDRGEHGHLGGYDRRFDVESHRLKVCETFDKLRGCGIPEKGHQCFDGVRRVTDEGPGVRLERHISGPAREEAGDRYRLVVKFGQHVADGGVDVAVEMTLPDEAGGEGPQVWSVAEIDGLTVEKSCGSIGGIHRVDYRDGLRGWVRRSGSPETARSEPPLKVYLETGSGTREDDSMICRPEPMALWGQFEVDEVVGHP